MRRPPVVVRVAAWMATVFGLEADPLTLWAGMNEVDLAFWSFGNVGQVGRAT